MSAVSGGRGTFAGEKWVGRVPIPTRGIHCGTLYMYVLCGVQSSKVPTIYSYTVKRIILKTTMILEEHIADKGKLFALPKKDFFFLPTTNKYPR
jgi:hypothetical protein